MILPTVTIATGRAKCRKCENKITRKELCLYILYNSIYQGSYGYIHLDCIDIDHQAMKKINARHVIRLKQIAMRKIAEQL